MIPAIVLAAGKSTRMGRPKAALPIGDGETFLSRIVRTFHAAGVEEVIVVTGHEAAAIEASLPRAAGRVRFIHNPDYESGQFSSFLSGLAAANRAEVSAVLLTLVDVPFVAAATIRAVVARYRDARAPIVRPTRGAEHGHPVLIDRSVFDELRAADRAAGMKPVVRAYASPAGELPIDDEGAFLDIDTVDEYRRAMAPR